MDAPRLVRLFNWRLRGKRPTHLDQFSERILELCTTFKPNWLVAAGTAPLTANALLRIRQLEIRRVNYLTDDPWNPAHLAPWFLDALPQYDTIWSTRCANLTDLRRAGCSDVRYLPFAYDPELHFPVSPAGAETEYQSNIDILFVGGADRDRVAYIGALIRSGLRAQLYGDYWERFAETREHTGGHAEPLLVRQAASRARVSVCLVRRANRDGHVMRSFEIPAMRGCMLTEDTTEHRAIFGDEGRAVVYFRSIPEMIEKARWLLDHPEERERLANAAHQLITGGKHTYRDRLVTMLELVGG